MRTFILNYKRTPIGNYLSTYGKEQALNLGIENLNFLLNDTDISKELIECAYVGNVLSAGNGQNIAKQITFKCDLNIPSITINNVCGSGMQAIIEGVKSLKLGDSGCCIVGGLESMSNTPYLQSNIKKGNKYGNLELTDSMLVDGLTDAFSGKHMGELTEELAFKENITRDVQDDYTVKSYIKSRKAWEENKFKDEVINFKITEDEEVNKIKDLNKISKARPVFKKEGTITAANASKLSDGSCFLILISENFMIEHNLKPIAEILDYDLTANNPNEFALAPVNSISKILNGQQLKHETIDSFEINEAFSIVPILVNKKLGIPFEKINRYGGAISLGHPLGCSGARIVSTLVTILKNENQKLGCASICNGGGGATSILIKCLVNK